MNYSTLVSFSLCLCVHGKHGLYWTTELSFLIETMLQIYVIIVYEIFYSSRASAVSPYIPKGLGWPRFPGLFL